MARPWMTCWDSAGLPRRFPAAIAEWKVISWRDGASAAEKKVRDHTTYDVPFLQRMSSEHAEFVGYAVLLDLRSESQFLRCARTFRGGVLPQWLSLEPGRPNSALERARV